MSHYIITDKRSVGHRIVAYDSTKHLTRSVIDFLYDVWNDPLLYGGSFEDNLSIVSAASLGLRAKSATHVVRVDLLSKPLTYCASVYQLPEIISECQFETRKFLRNKQVLKFLSARGLSKQTVTDMRDSTNLRILSWEDTEYGAPYTGRAIANGTSIALTKTRLLKYPTDFI